MSKSSIAVYLSGKKPTPKETINNVIEIKENEHSFSVWTAVYKNNKKRINKQVFSKPEYVYMDYAGGVEA